MEQDTDLRHLEALAEKADDLFSLAPPDAPGAVFAGALFSAGQPGAQTRFSAGAADDDPLRARRRCLGEIAETLAQFADAEALGALDAPQGLTRQEALQLAAMAGLAGPWLPAWRLGGGAAALPAALCLRAPGPDDGAARASSLGCAAGETREKAVRSALFELIERDAVALWWHGGLPAAPVAWSPLLQADLSRLAADLRQNRAGRHLQFLDLTTDFGVPVAAAVSCGADGGRLALGFGADAAIGPACRSALFEMIQMEMGGRIVEMKAARMGAESLSGPDRMLLDRLNGLHISMLPFRPETGEKQHVGWPADAVAVVAAIVEMLAESGIAVFGVDLAKAPDQIPVVKLVSPNLQPLPMLWHSTRLNACKKRHGARLAHFPTLGLL